ncbi:MAG: STAS domain-containing protein [Chloroflexales bacterium]|nr:STAS domain-containing protein [Chloroflexales bacterium]
MLAPLIGALDAERSEQLLERTLEVVSERQGRVVIFDVTGMSFVDGDVANTILRTAHAARLLGVQTILCGIRPEVAQVLISLGVSMKDLRTNADLHSRFSARPRTTREKLFLLRQCYSVYGNTLQIEAVMSHSGEALRYSNPRPAPP